MSNGSWQMFQHVLGLHKKSTAVDICPESETLHGHQVSSLSCWLFRVGGRRNLTMAHEDGFHRAIAQTARLLLGTQFPQPYQLHVSHFFHRPLMSPTCQCEGEPPVLFF